MTGAARLPGATEGVAPIDNATREPDGRTPRQPEAPVAVPVWPVFVAYGAVLVLSLAGGFLLLALAIARLRSQDPSPQDGRQGLLRAAEEAIGSPGLLVASSVLTNLVLLVVSLLAARGAGPAGPSRRLRIHSSRMTARGLAASVVGFVAFSQVPDSCFGLLGWSPGGALEYLGRAIGAARGPTLALLVVTIGPLAGFAEELFFRGFMQTRLRPRWGAWPAVLVTSAAFGLLHLDLVHSAFAFLAGIFLGWITERAGSIRPAIAAHAGGNTVAVLSVAAFPPPWPPAVHGLLLVLAAAAAVVCVRLVIASSPPGGQASGDVPSGATDPT